MKSSQMFQIPGLGEHRVTVRASMKRRRSVAARRDGDGFLVMVPATMAMAETEAVAEKLVSRLLRREQSAQISDEDLSARADRLARRYLDHQWRHLHNYRWPIRPSQITWVSNQNSRWGSCSPQTGMIRLSDRLASMPSWVIDYVVLHELVHLVEPRHSTRFHEFLSGYPRAEQARGFLHGWSAALAHPTQPDWGPEAGLTDAVEPDQPEFE